MAFDSGPDFVGAVEDEDFVYFFFREEAVEFINCGKVHIHLLVTAYILYM